MKKTRFNQITREELKLAVKKSDFLSEVLLYFGYGKNSGSMYGYFKKKIKELNIDDSHLGIGKGNVPYKTSKDNYYVYSLDEILIENSKYNNNTRLKKRIIKAGLLEYKCAICKNTGVWMNKKMTLQLDHINGDNTDNRLENLRILCPNCHSQTPTYGNKNRRENIQTKKGKKKRKRIIKKICKNCNNVYISKSKIQKYCSTQCVKNKKSTRIPIKSEFILQITRLKCNFTQIGKYYGVSDNAIRKWCKKYNIPHKSKELKKFIEKNV